MTRLKHLVIGTPQGTSGNLLKESRFVFNYSATDRRCEVSLTMPIRAESYSSGGLLPIFEMNRPEGYLLSKIEEAMAKHGRLGRHASSRNRRALSDRSSHLYGTRP